MNQLWLVMLGGALGAACRYGAGYWAASATTAAFPSGTFAVNIAGSFFIGLLWGAYGESTWFSEWGRAVLVVGFLGAFTTFSAFSFETVQMIDTGRIGMAITYILASVVACVVLAGAGFAVGTRAGA